MYIYILLLVIFLFVHIFAAKVRRLYDIANVLRSLKLIEKVHVTEERGRKPAFEWVGPEEFPLVKGGFVVKLIETFLFSSFFSMLFLFNMYLCYTAVYFGLLKSL